MRASKNAMTCGFHAKTPVVPGEDRVAYVQLKRRMYEERPPVRDMEEMLLHQAVNGMWRLRRLDSDESSHLEHEQKKQACELGPSTTVMNGRPLDLASACEDALDRSAERSIECAKAAARCPLGTRSVGQAASASAAQ
jgi:hypothetical protein